MGHAVDQNLLSLVQQDVKELIKTYKKSEAEQSAIQESLASIQDQQSVTRAQLEEHVEQLEAVLEWREQQMNENDKIVETLVSVEKTVKEELMLRLAETDDKVQQLEQEVRSQKVKVNQPGTFCNSLYQEKQEYQEKRNTF